MASATSGSATVHRSCRQRDRSHGWQEAHTNRAWPCPRSAPPRTASSVTPSKRLPDWRRREQIAGRQPEGDEPEQAEQQLAGGADRRLDGQARPAVHGLPVRHAAQPAARAASLPLGPAGAPPRPARPGHPPRARRPRRPDLPCRPDPGDGAVLGVVRRPGRLGSRPPLPPSQAVATAPAGGAPRRGGGPVAALPALGPRPGAGGVTYLPQPSPDKGASWDEELSPDSQPTRRASGDGSKATNPAAVATGTRTTPRSVRLWSSTPAAGTPMIP